MGFGNRLTHPFATNMTQQNAQYNARQAQREALRDDGQADHPTRCAKHPQEREIGLAII